MQRMQCREFKPEGELNVHAMDRHLKCGSTNGENNNYSRSHVHPSVTVQSTCSCWQVDPCRPQIMLLNIIIVVVVYVHSGTSLDEG